MNEKSPLTTIEVRWFFQGNVDEHRALRKWFERDAIEIRDWEPREDIYLLVPGSNDLGIKWRENQLQIKGLISCEKQSNFGKEHQGKIQHWIRWTYGQLPTEYQRLFTAQSGIITASVQKIRALRKIDLTKKPREVNVKTNLNRAMEIELTDIKVTGKVFCTLGFEAYPDDAPMNAAFSPTVESFLTNLKEIHLLTEQSHSYPAWLNSIL